MNGKNFWSIARIYPTTLRMIGTTMSQMSIASMRIVRLS